MWLPSHCGSKFKYLPKNQEGKDPPHNSDASVGSIESIYI